MSKSGVNGSGAAMFGSAVSNLATDRRPIKMRDYAILKAQIANANNPS